MSAVQKKLTNTLNSSSLGESKQHSLRTDEMMRCQLDLVCYCGNHPDDSAQWFSLGFVYGDPERPSTILTKCGLGDSTRGGEAVARHLRWFCRISGTETKCKGVVLQIQLCECVALFYWTNFWGSLRSRGLFASQGCTHPRLRITDVPPHPGLPQTTLARRIFTLHLNSFAGYTSPLLFLFQLTSQLREDSYTYLLGCRMQWMAQACFLGVVTWYK